MVEIPVINVDLNVDKFKPENLVWGDKYNAKKDKKKIYKILAYLAIIAALIIFFRFALLAYLYIANLPKINSYDANIERIALSDDGKQAYIKLTGGNQKEIESIKFIFRTNESEFVYETTDGIKEITYEDKRLLGYFAHPEYEGSYDYSINAIDMGLDNFKGIIKVEVSIKFKDEKTGEVKETKTIDSSKKSDINIVRSGGYSGGSGGSGGSSGGGSGSGDIGNNQVCTPNCNGKSCGTDGCSGTCGICNDNNECTDETCNSGSCSFVNKSEGSICSTGTCKSGRCVSCQSDSECNDNINCTTDKCTLGRCEIITNNNLCTSGNICDRFYGCVPEIHITQEWLNSKGSSPYYLDTAGAKYILETDVTTPGSAFVILANNIDFDLNGHTIIYSDYNPISVENGDFEECVGRNIPGWDFTNAPRANVSKGSFIQPVSVYSGNNSVNFQVIPGIDNTQEIKSNFQVNLEANTTYTLSGMLFNYAQGNYTCSGDNGNNGICTNNLTIYVGFEGTNIFAGQRGTTWRGFQYRQAEFTTGAIPVSYNIVAGVRDINGGIKTNGIVYIDDIKIQKTKNFGVLISSISWSPKATPDVKRYTSSGRIENHKVFNGKIVQGRGGSSFSPGINAIYTRSGEFYNLNITSYGADSYVFIFNIDGPSDNISIHDNILYSNVKTIASRDNFGGTVLSVDAARYNEIYNNKIIGGPHAGIVVWSGNSSNIVNFYNNSVSTKTYYSNGFAIVVGSSCKQIYNNKIDCISQDYSCRGLAVGGNNCPGSKVYNNLVEIRELKRNQEYSGCCLGGGYGIQFEYAPSNVDFFNNTIKAYASECEASAFRANPGEGGSFDLDIHDNTFEGIKLGNNSGPTAHSIKIDNFNDLNENISFVNNRIITNSQWILGGNLNGFYLRNNLFEINPINLENTFEPLHGSYWPRDQINSANNIRFIDNRYPNEEARNKFYNSSFMQNNNNGGYKFDPYSNFYYSWTANISVVDSNSNPISGINVIIKNNLNEEKFNGNTDSNGRIISVLDEFKNHGGNRTYFNNYSVIVNNQIYSINVSKSTEIRIIV
ncbi:MAG: hypothetical protein WC867_03955 [Candidatus Pacearchaeota archaeon]|jgi:uncharacterized membrane protein YgcG